jgi:hypothetical protein
MHINIPLVLAGELQVIVYSIAVALVLSHAQVRQQAPSLPQLLLAQPAHWLTPGALGRGYLHPALGLVCSRGSHPGVP